MAIHVAHIALMHIDSVTGDVIRKDTAAIKDFTTQTQPIISRPREFSTEHRVVEDATNTNTLGNPTIADYLTLEDGDGLMLVHMDQTFIITQEPLP